MESSCIAWRGVGAATATAARIYLVPRSERNETRTADEIRVSEHAAQHTKGADWLQRARDKVHSFATTVPKDGYGTPPSPLALERADQLLRLLHGENLKPTRISPMAEGGVSFRYKIDEATSARIEVANSGSFVFVYDPGFEQGRKYDQPTSAADATRALADRMDRVI